jgi:hypothetical protein
MAIDAMLATIANGGQAVADIISEADRNELNYCSMKYFVLNPLAEALAGPFRRGSQSWGIFHLKTMPLERQLAPSWWGCLCAVCFASQKHSKREFFVSNRMNLAVKLFI